MKILLTAVNAKYIHSNLGIYSLKAYADQVLGLGEAGGRNARAKNRGTGTGAMDPAKPCIELAEYTINHQLDQILQDIFRREPDVIAFSCYIWNIEYIRYLIADLGKILPDVPIWLGGPEVSFDAAKVLGELPEATGVMKGEGEETFTQLAGYYVDKLCEKGTDSGKILPDGQACLENIPGLAFRLPDGSLADTGVRRAMDMSRIPFPYKHMDIKDLEHRIIYYESSRGCPFSCSYCLSSIDKSVRFRSLELVLDAFLGVGHAGEVRHGGALAVGLDLLQDLKVLADVRAASAVGAGDVIRVERIELLKHAALAAQLLHANVRLRGEDFKGKCVALFHDLCYIHGVCLLILWYLCANEARACAQYTHFDTNLSYHKRVRFSSAFP